MDRFSGAVTPSVPRAPSQLALLQGRREERGHLIRPRAIKDGDIHLRTPMACRSWPSEAQKRSVKPTGYHYAQI